ncbi:2'-5' RNA ligase family protein [Salinarimonas soli]|uniref:2'-5' RNA ligase family protein n=1 Tax=Salinarimonas soli TaxID=1638099 RepID=A0A5B2VRI1_9HYPH|nr:2'-5' RNA ligase family protein [Salinarimonas soli]KAA2241210.1 2'-5' RNA ligase family protein [Salinarimonas soli]
MPSPDRTDPLILTLGFDAETFSLLNGLRQAHFPPERNFIPAHLTLFHHLPGPELAGIVPALRRACAGRGAIPLRVTGLRSLGRGVAFTVEAPELAALRRELAALWSGWLGPQDRQGFRPHVTIQNKVAPSQAAALLARLQAGFVPFEGSGEALLLWHYRGGPWEPAGVFPFAP